MATHVGIGGLIGAGIGACFFPVLGPTAIPIMTSLAAAGAKVGWDAANAERVRDVADQTMRIIDARSQDCVQIFADKIGRGSSALLEKGSRVMDSWNRVAISGCVAAGSIGLNYLANQVAHHTCSEDPLSLPCAPTTMVNITTTISTFLTVSALAGKACQILYRADQVSVTESVAQAQEPQSHSDQVVTRAEDTVRNRNPQQAPLETSWTRVKNGGPLNLKGWYYDRKDEHYYDRLGGYRFDPSKNRFEVIPGTYYDAFTNAHYTIIGEGKYFCEENNIYFVGEKYYKSSGIKLKPKDPSWFMETFVVPWRGRSSPPLTGVNDEILEECGIGDPGPKDALIPIRSGKLWRFEMEINSQRYRKEYWDSVCRRWNEYSSRREEFLVSKSS